MSFSKSCWTVRRSKALWMTLYKRLLPANNFSCDDISSSMSLMYSRIQSGTKTVPWGTPDFTTDISLRTPSLATCGVRFTCHASIQARAWPQIPQWSSFRGNHLWVTVLKALENTSISRLVRYWWSIDCARCSVVLGLTWLVLPEAVLVINNNVVILKVWHYVSEMTCSKILHGRMLLRLGDN